MVINWFRKNVPMKSFVNMMIDDSSMLADARSMMDTILNQNSDFKYDGRWRVRTFHDYIQSESWKIRNVNVELPQVLFPEPVKVNDYTFLQPVDTHQLAKWGQTVRNCVGNASNYAQGVINKKHFIVLAMEGKNPKFTVQMSLRDSQLVVTQIVEICNRRLTHEENETYSNLFTQAMQIRETQLAV